MIGLGKELDMDMAKGKAIHDFHYSTIYNGYEAGTDQYLMYEETILELKEKANNDYAQEQIDTAKTLGEGE